MVYKTSGALWRVGAEQQLLQCPQTCPSPVPVQSHLPAAVAIQQLWAQSLETGFALFSKLPLYAHDLSRVAKS